MATVLARSAEAVGKKMKVPFTSGLGSITIEEVNDIRGRFIRIMMYRKGSLERPWTSVEMMADDEATAALGRELLRLSGQTQADVSKQWWTQRYLELTQLVKEAYLEGREDESDQSYGVERDLELDWKYSDAKAKL